MYTVNTFPLLKSFSAFYCNFDTDNSPYNKKSINILQTYLQTYYMSVSCSANKKENK